MCAIHQSDRPHPAVLSVLRCQTCGGMEQLREDDLVPYVLSGWPTCCGVVMRLPARHGPDIAPEPAPARRN